jgi:GNAT superfamily N-acetyltransferase
MPHDNLTEYVSLSQDKGISLVATVGPVEKCRIIAEARYVSAAESGLAEVAFMVDENFQGRGIASFLLNYLIEIARERGLKGLQADVLISNNAMLKIFENLPFVIHSTIEDGVVSLKFKFDELKETSKPPAGSGEDA